VSFVFAREARLRLLTGEVLALDSATGKTL
jgi:hypothetical protein